MYYCILILMAAAILHFVYESIIAPSLRLELRLDLLRLRDEVRLLKIENSRAAGEGAEFVDRHLRVLQDSIDSLAGMLFKFDLVTVCAISDRIDRDVELKRRVAARARILDNCVLPGVLAIRREQLRIAAKALAVNSGPMLLGCAVPASLFVGYQTVRNKIKSSLTVPGTDLKPFMPDERELGVMAI
ncbi:hypothetical protein ACFPN2_10925 [Steroidobacter flavus]|uniref:Uncharacterized protein n=1 Tax=Steroidobacter flavus TaxID=1842136 RepID=A0ABV8SQ16_9GAMM